MREWNKPASTLLLGFGLWTLCLYLYLSHLSFNYTFDGLAMSGQVEKDSTPLYLFFHPHHLLYTFLGRLFFLWGRDHGATWDGLVALQVLDLMTGLAGVLLAFHLLVRETNDRLVAALAAAGMAFSHSYWYFSTIPGVRIFATVTPLLAWYLLTYQKRMPAAFGWVTGSAHGLAVLGHQTNLLLVPAFLGAILILKEKTWWEKLRACLYYLVSLTLIVLAAYGLVGRYVNYRKTFHDWLWWVFSYFHSPQNWGGHFDKTGFGHGQSAMVRAFLPHTRPLDNMAEPFTFGSAETILQCSVLFLLAVFLLRLPHYWKHNRQTLWVAVTWVAAFVPFFVWWEPWNIEFWVSSTVPCWILMGVVGADLSQLWKNPVLHFANRGMTICLWTFLITLLFFHNAEGRGSKLVANHYDFQELLGALDWKVRADDVLVLDGINNVHYYLDRFQKRKYLSLYNFLRTYKTIGDKETGKNPEKEKNKKASAGPDPWGDLSEVFQDAWKRHRKVWALTETVDSIDGGRQLLEETLKLPEGTIREYFVNTYKLKPIAYHKKVYFYEVLKPVPTPAAATVPSESAVDSAPTTAPQLPKKEKPGKKP